MDKIYEGGEAVAEKAGRILAALLALVLLLTGCAGKAPEATQPRSDFTPYAVPEFAGSGFHPELAEDLGSLKVDCSALEQGCVALSAVSDRRLKFQVLLGEMKYTYDIPSDGTPTVLPLNMGDGTYTFRLMESVGDSKYACLWSGSREVTMLDEFQPFLRPSSMVSYNADSACGTLARELAAKCETDAEVASAVYAHLVENITYDREKAAAVQPGYIPDPDSTLEEGKGICFDYAALAAAMLRGLGIPCKLITGYVDEIYHAWNCFYIREQGWVTVEIRANANTWQRVDITFAAGGADAEDLMNDSKYTTRFTY